MKISTLLLGNVRLRASQIHKLRGFVGNLFKAHDLIHNHDPDTGRVIYRYPLIQFKLLKGTPAIISVGDEAVKVFAKIFMAMDEVVIDNVRIPVYEKDLRVEEVAFGYSQEVFAYVFVSPWIGLNQANHRIYVRLGDKGERDRMLTRALVGNILSMSKYLDCWLGKDQRIMAEVRLREQTVNLKGRPLIGFSGMFKTNFVIPDDLGIGKSVSRGFGTVKKRM